MNTVYLVLIIPQISDRLDNRVFRFVTGEVPTREGILNYLRAPKDLRTLYLGSQPATDIMTTEALHDEFDHLAEPLIPSIEKDDFPHPIQGIQSVGTYIYVGLAQLGWIGIQTVPVLSLGGPHWYCHE